MSEIEVISNTVNNHLDRLKEFILRKSDRLIIASPYLASNIEGLLNEFSFENTKSIELITTFKPNDPDQIKKPNILKTYFEHFQTQYPKVKAKLHVDNKLHGKIYISSKNSDHLLLIGSANFTKNGLCNNHEWSLGISDQESIEKVLEDLFAGIEYEEITYNQILKACEIANFYKEKHPEWTKTPEISGNTLEYVYTVESKENTNPSYFLKPIGHSERPVLLENQEDFSDLHQNLHFSKKMPKGVKKGDIVITTAVGGGALLSYFIVTGGLRRVTEEEIESEPWKERWPWYMEGRNQAVAFSGKWWTYNIQRKDVLTEFLNKSPSTPVTYAGGFSLGTLNRGNDKVRITKEFGDFLISKIVNTTN